MNKVVLLSCVALKRDYQCKAVDMYTSTYFKLNYQYALTLHPDFIFIISAKHGVLELDTIIEPYDVTLNTMKKKDRIEWGNLVRNQLVNEKGLSLSEDHFTFLAGQRYVENLIPYITHYSKPFNDTIGITLGKLKDILNKPHHIEENIF